MSDGSGRCADPARETATCGREPNTGDSSSSGFHGREGQVLDRETEHEDVDGGTPTVGSGASVQDLEGHRGTPVQGLEGHRGTPVEARQPEEVKTFQPKTVEAGQSSCRQSLAKVRKGVCVCGCGCVCGGGGVSLKSALFVPQTGLFPASTAITRDGS